MKISSAVVVFCLLSINECRTLMERAIKNHNQSLKLEEYGVKSVFYQHIYFEKSETPFFDMSKKCWERLKSVYQNDMRGKLTEIYFHYSEKLFSTSPRELRTFPERFSIRRLYWLWQSIKMSEKISQILNSWWAEILSYLHRAWSTEDWRIVKAQHSKSLSTGIF